MTSQGSPRFRRNRNKSKKQGIQNTGPSQIDSIPPDEDIQSTGNGRRAFRPPDENNQSTKVGNGRRVFTPNNASPPKPVVPPDDEIPIWLKTLIKFGISIMIILILYIIKGGEKRTKYLGLVGVETTYESAHIRAALRATWFPANHHDDDHFREAGLKFVFVIGKTKGKEKREIEEENFRYRDILILTAEENIQRSKKTLAFFKAAYKKYDAEYYIKADDHIYLRSDRLETMLSKKKTKPFAYFGCKKIQRFNKDKDIVFALGSLYILSANVVKKLAVAEPDFLPKSMPEDYAIGYLMDKMSVKLVSIKLEENTELCQTYCTPKFVAVWNFSSSSSAGPNNDFVSKLKELHMSSNCSKTPPTQSEKFYSG